MPGIPFHIFLLFVQYVWDNMYSETPLIWTPVNPETLHQVLFNHIYETHISTYLDSLTKMILVETLSSGLTEIHCMKVYLSCLYDAVDCDEVVQIPRKVDGRPRSLFCLLENHRRRLKAKDVIGEHVINSQRYFLLLGNSFLFLSTKFLYTYNNQYWKIHTCDDYHSFVNLIANGDY